MKKLYGIIFLCVITASVLETGYCGILDGDNYKKAAFLLSGPRSFIHYCAPCHGETGEGGGRYFPTELEPMPANIREMVKNKQVTAEHIRKLIKGGSASLGKSNLCPAWVDTLPMETIESVCEYIMSLSEERQIKDELGGLQPQFLKEGIPAWLWLILGTEIIIVSLIGKTLLKLKRKSKIGDV